MKKFAFAAVVAIAAFLVTLGYSPSAQAYPDPNLTLTASKQIVTAGDTFAVTAAANVDCSWSESWNNEGRASAGTKFVAQYTAPQVTTITKLPVKASCSYADTSSASRTVAKASSEDLTITVLPGAAAAAGGAKADLPNSGGPNKLFVFSGLVLLLAGAVAVRVARRRAEAEYPAYPTAAMRRADAELSGQNV